MYNIYLYIIYMYVYKISKADRLCMKFSSTPNANAQRCLNPLFQNKRPHFLLLSLF